MPASASGATARVAARIANELDDGNVVVIVADDGWRYLSSGINTRLVEEIETLDATVWCERAGLRERANVQQPVESGSLPIVVAAGAPAGSVYAADSSWRRCRRLRGGSPAASSRERRK